MASIYRDKNATLGKEVNLRRNIKKRIDSGELDSIDKQPPHAVAYGLLSKDGACKLFKWSKVFYSAESFDRYVKENRQIVLAVYSHR